MQVVRTQIELR